MQTTANSTALSEATRVLWLPGSVYELRVLNTPRHTISGYFDDPDRFVQAAASWDGKTPAVYVTLNPVKPALLARANNRCHEAGTGSTTADHDIDRRTWLPIDFDAIRPAGISASDEEHQGALDRAEACWAWLLERGCPADAIVYADSGNGGHVLVRVDLPNDDEARDLMQRCLQAIALRFDDEDVAVDLHNYNAARIWKVYGTLVRKGEDMPERPHRRAALLSAPDTPIAAPHSFLEELATAFPKPTPIAKHGTAFDIDAWMRQYLWHTLTYEAPWNGGHKYVLQVCPFNSDHDDKSAVVLQHQSGAISFTCHHNGCTGRSWSELRALYEPKEPPAKPRPQQEPTAPSRPQAAAPPPSMEKTSLPKLVTLPSMRDVQLEDVRWLWHPYVPLGKFTLLEGDPGVRKSWLALAIASAVSLGAPLPGESLRREGARVLLLAGEDGLGDTVKPRLLAMEAHLDFIRPVTGLLRADEEEPMTLDQAGIAALIAEVESYRPSLVIIDPLVAYTSRDVDMNKANEVRSMLRPLTDMAQRLRVAILALRHLNKVAGSSASYRGQGSIDYFAISRSVLFVGVDKNDPTRSIMAPNKSSLTRKGPGQAFKLGPGPHGAEFLWDGAVDTTVEELLATPEEPDQISALDEAKRFLRESLFEGPVTGREIQKSARDAGIAERTLWRAKAELKVHASKQQGAGGQWQWEIPHLSEGKSANAAKYGPRAHDWQDGRVEALPYKDNDEEEPF